MGVRARRGGRRALSEIVGTLMLVLIVVSAAVAFSLFIAAYEKQLTSEQSFSQQRSLEALRVLSVVPTLNASNGGANWTSLTFLLASEYVNPSVITSMSLDGTPLAEYTASPVSSGGSIVTTVAFNQTLSLPPRAQESITVTFTHYGRVPFFSFFAPGYSLPSSSYIKLDVFTGYQNDFSRVFVPPTAIAIVSSLVSLNGGVPRSVPILDGSNSFQPVNGTLVRWAWSVANVTTNITGGPFPAVGEKSAFPSGLGALNGPGLKFNITLVVTNSDGLEASDAIAYTTG